jgi:aryl-alcohol dehydrogenase-like predicted oxidoreductase
LAQGEDILTIPGMKTRSHLAQNVTALNVTLNDAEQKALAGRISALAVQGDRHAPAMMKVLDG